MEIAYVEAFSYSERYNRKYKLPNHRGNSLAYPNVQNIQVTKLLLR
jgi:hypothetical protein